MRVLVTNAWSPQAYFVVLGLRPYAEWIVAAPDRRSCFVAYSKYVDVRYAVPAPSVDFSFGRLQDSNTKAEQDYLEAILNICAKENIDTIVPSNEPDIYVLSKNKRTLNDLGIVVTVPDFDKLLLLVDKAETLRLARKHGIPCPRTILFGEETDVLSQAKEIGPPWIVKPRSASSGTGMAIVTDPAQLRETLAFVAKYYKDPLIQELVPGAEKQNFYVILDSEGKAKFVHCPKIVRYCRRLYRNSTAAALSRTEHPWLPQVKRFVEALGMRGALTVQTKIDARDGLPKLMEINVGIRTNDWYWDALGINSPLLCTRIERNEDDLDVAAIPSDVMLLDPIGDFVNLGTELADWAVFSVRRSILRKQPADPLNTPPSPAKIALAYFENYLGGHKKAFCPMFKHMPSDPKPNLLGSLMLAQSAVRNLRKVGY